jgi:molybdate transport system ATP-binding protein
MTSLATIRVAFRGRLGRFDLDVAFAVPATGVTVVFGPSGCGKTSVLRCIAGLQKFPRGFCAIADDVWQDGHKFLPTHKRPIGYVFQEASLFAHLSVERNLRYGAPRTTRIGFDEVTDLLSLNGLLDRSPNQLSGGERQRVAIGRALLSQPRLLLMDEPLSALDRRTKDEILPFLEVLQHRVALPIIYVTHDMNEVERLADHLVLMDAGRVIAAGPLADLQCDLSLPPAKERDAAVSLDAAVSGYDAAYGLARLTVDGAAFVVPSGPIQVGERRRLRVFALDVSLALDRPTRTTISNVVPARIVTATLLDRHEMIVVVGIGPDGNGAKLLSRITRRSWEALELGPGVSLYAQVKGVALVANT